MSKRLGNAYGMEMELMSEHLPIIDQNMIQELLSLSEPGYEFFLEIVTMYEEKSFELVQLLNVEMLQLEKGIFDLNIIAHAHRFKGVNYNIGAQQLASWCARLEAACRSQEWGQVPLIYRDLLICYEMTKIEVGYIKGRFINLIDK